VFSSATASSSCSCHPHLATHFVYKTLPKSKVPDFPVVICWYFVLTLVLERHIQISLAPQPYPSCQHPLQKANCFTGILHSLLESFAPTGTQTTSRCVSYSLHKRGFILSRLFRLLYLYILLQRSWHNFAHGLEPCIIQMTTLDIFKPRTGRAFQPSCLT